MGICKNGVLPLWHILGSVALLGDVVVDQAQLTSLSPGGHAVQANVELGAVFGVSILGVGVQDTGVSARDVWALEPADSHLVLCKIRKRQHLSQGDPEFFGTIRGNV